jgi:hypothetical protein
MHFSVVAAATLAFVSACKAQAVLAIPHPSEKDIQASRETALTLSPTSHVRGRSFDHFVRKSIKDPISFLFRHVPGEEQG